MAAPNIRAIRNCLYGRHIVVVVFIDSARLGTPPHGVKSYKYNSKMVDTSKTLFTT